MAAIRPLGDLLYWTPGEVKTGQTNMRIGQKSYDEFRYKAVVVAPGAVGAKLGRNELRPYKSRAVSEPE